MARDFTSQRPFPSIVAGQDIGPAPTKLPPTPRARCVVHRGDHDVDELKLPGLLSGMSENSQQSVDSDSSEMGVEEEEAMWRYGVVDEVIG